MSDIKILHIADVHLGRKYNQLSESKAELRRSEVLVTFENTIGRFSDAKIVLISGDLFDADCSENTVSFVNSVFKKYSDRTFFVSLGNHDYLGSPAIQKLKKDLPENVIVFDDTMQTFDVSDDLCVSGISFASNSSYVSLMRNFEAKKGKINIVVMHGDAQNTSQYNPITIDEIKNCGAHYLALGHIHTFSGIYRAGDTIYSYPGVLEPGGFDETSDCGVVYGTIGKDTASLDFYPVARRKYIKTDLDITGFTSDEEVIVALKELINPDYLYCINLVGRNSLFTPNIKLYSEIVSPFYIEIQNNTQREDSILNYARECSLRGKTAQHLMNLKENSDEKAYKMACDILTDLMCKG